jgi:hypothetical protein
VLAYLAAGGVTLALGDWVAGGGWLPLRLVLLARPPTPPWRGASIPRRRCCIPPPAGERAATTRALAFNLRILAVLGGSAPAVPPGRAGACLTGAVVLTHAVALTPRVGRALAARLGHTVWFYPIQVSRRWVIERTHAWATSSASGAGAPNGAEG